MVRLLRLQVSTPEWIQRGQVPNYLTGADTTNRNNSDFAPHEQNEAPIALGLPVSDADLSVPATPEDDVLKSQVDRGGEVSKFIRVVSSFYHKVDWALCHRLFARTFDAAGDRLIPTNHRHRAATRK